jgi:trimeric autotransporter adhesin
MANKRSAWVLLVFMFFLPKLANATWYVSASASPSAGGTVSPAGTTSYTDTTLSASYTVTPNLGYTVSSVKVGGIAVTPAGGTYSVAKKTGTQSLVAYFAAQSASVTSSVTSGLGAISAAFSSPLPSNLVVGGTYTFNITPNAGYAIKDVKADGVSVGAVSTYTFRSITAGAHTLSAAFNFIPAVTASVSTGGSMIVGNPVFLTGVATTNDTGFSGYAFAVRSGGTTVFSQTGAASTAQFTPMAPGRYDVTFTATSVNGGTGTGSTFCDVVTAKTASVNDCAACHSARNPAVVSNYKGSVHFTGEGPSCAGCHNPAGSLPHPYPPDTAKAACSGCHTVFPNWAPHLGYAGTSICVTCHDPHTTLASTGPPAHYNNITTAGYPASYVTSRSACGDCHVSTSNNQQIRQDWEASGHAAPQDTPWASRDFKTLTGCAQCHTTTGFIAYSTGRVAAAWGQESDHTKELLSCKGCHTDITNGIVRILPRTRPYAGNPYTTPDAGKSNICIPCHSGRNIGQSITDALTAGADFRNLPFIDPHELAAAGTLARVSGYSFPGRTYGLYSSHRRIGAVNGSGPCVSCHKGTTAGHTFIASTTAPICANCHTAGFTDATLTTDKAAFTDALKVLQAQLTAKGFVFTASDPRFAVTNWGSGQDGANAMGAAFNYALFQSEPGGYAHDPTYARQLILDSIDYLDNGSIDGSIETVAIPNLLAAGLITDSLAQSLTAYKAKTSCTSCHGGTTSTATPMATGAHPAHLGGDYGPGSYLGSDLASCQTCHIYGSATHLNGVVDLTQGAGSACRSCHPGSLPSWSGTTKIACTSCHAATPSILPNGVAAPYKGKFATTGHGLFAASNDCTVCHDPDSRHIYGSLGNTVRLRLSNDNGQCASCHNDPAKVGGIFLNMSTHVDKDGQPLACTACHDPHGTTNLAMIRTQINGTAITFTDEIGGLIDTVTNRGLCQVCHTKTTHYRAGVPETDHATSGCLGCHSHKSPGGAFKPTGGTCDSCHGYPPAPVVPSVPFGTVNNWANARSEDYPGGGGAHLVAAHVSPSAKPSDGWVNCTLCHNGGKIASAPYHRMQTPVSTHIDSVHIEVDLQYRFSNTFTIYTSARQVNPPSVNATGSCFNISCHMSPSPRWSSER